jgi:hypothetical protein
MRSGLTKLMSRAVHIRPLPVRLLSGCPHQQQQQQQQQQQVKDQIEPLTRSEIATEKWINSFICGLNLCPFAKEVVQANKLLIQEITGEDRRAVAKQIIEKAIALDEGEGEDPFESAVLIVPQFKEFDAYLDLVDDIQTVLDASELSEDIQVATFHPRYKFQGTDPSDVSNWTNKSPFPLIHLLRVDDVSRAVDVYKGNTDVIWTRNIKLMEKMGSDKLIEMMRECLKRPPVPDAEKEQEIHSIGESPKSQGENNAVSEK